jgi:subtilisin-like proprotein convertase family protein
MKRFLSAAVLILAFLASVPPALAQPNELTLQGVLRTAGGELVNGTYPMKFSFYENEQGGNPVATVSLPGVKVENGMYSATLGLGLQELAKTYGQLWLGVSVENQAEYPRVKLASVVYAMRSRFANTALDLACSGCIEEQMLDFDPVTKAELNTGDLTVKGKVTAAAFFGDGSGLTGITSPKGNCAEGFYVSGIKADGTLVCGQVKTVTSVDGLTGGTIQGDVEVTGALSVNGAEVCTDDFNCGATLAQLTCAKDQFPVWDGATWTCKGFKDLFKASDLPADGLNEISNNLIYNQYSDTYSSTTVPVSIKDFYPPGVTDKLTVPDAGLAQTFSVAINITNSDISKLTVILFDPAGDKYVLYDKGLQGTELGTTYPDPTKPVSGNLASWVGKNPAGVWILQAVDASFNDVEFDGKINSWSIQVQTLSSKKVQVKGNLIVDGNITTVGGKGITIDPTGNTTFSGSVKIGPDAAKCTAANKGALRYEATYGLEACNGTEWQAAVARPVIWRGYCSNHGTAGGWNTYCLNTATHNTADKYFTVNSNGTITFKIAGWYRTAFWCISNGSGTAHASLSKNGSTYYYGHEYVHGTWSDTFADDVQQFNVGDTFYAQVYNPGSYAYHSGSASGAHSGFSITYMGPLAP